LPTEQELRIELPVKAFIPPGWVAQEALRLELYRRISLAGDHATLRQIHDETVDRYGVLPEQVETLFAIASLRVTGLRLGVQEIVTYRDQVRLSPVAISDELLEGLEERVYRASFHAEKATLNLVPERVFGMDLVRFVERGLRDAVDDPIESVT
jgi:transcription-repair coupling factor (superfamily II helicase)